MATPAVDMSLYVLVEDMQRYVGQQLDIQLQARVEQLEEQIRGGGGGGAMQGQRSLLHYKNMSVGVLEKIDQWRMWKYTDRRNNARYL